MTKMTRMSRTRTKNANEGNASVARNGRRKRSLTRKIWISLENPSETGNADSPHRYEKTIAMPYRDQTCLLT